MFREAPGACNAGGKFPCGYYAHSAKMLKVMTSATKTHKYH
jgi:hypothetical protein